MRLPQKTLPKRKSKFKLTKSQLVMVAGGAALLLYVILTALSAVYLADAAQETDIDKRAAELFKRCEKKDPAAPAAGIDHITYVLNHAVGVTVKLIFWTWLVIIYILTLMVYIVYTIAGWQQSYSLGRAWCFVIAVITILNFVPCSYIFSFGDVSKGEKLAYWAMIAVILLFRGLDTAAMLILLKEIREKKALRELKSGTGTALQSEGATPGGSTSAINMSNPMLMTPPPPPPGTNPNGVTKVNVETKVTSDPGKKRTSGPPGNPFEEPPPSNPSQP